MIITYRKATPQDVIAIHRIEQACFSQPWSFASLYADITTNNLAVYLVAQAGDELAGYCGLHNIFDEGHIMNVAVHPAYRRRGIGEGLLTTIMSLTKLNFYTLEVRVSNLGAISLYKKLGYEMVGTRPRYYGNEDALIMLWRKNAP